MAFIVESNLSKNNLKANHNNKILWVKAHRVESNLSKNNLKANHNVSTMNVFDVFVESNLSKNNLKANHNIPMKAAWEQQLKAIYQRTT